jgi:hypothetical protein
MISKHLQEGDKLSYYRTIGDKHIGDFEIVGLYYRFDKKTGLQYPIYYVNIGDMIVKCSSKTGNQKGTKGMWYFCEIENQ